MFSLKPAKDPSPFTFCSTSTAQLPNEESKENRSLNMATSNINQFTGNQPQHQQLPLPSYNQFPFGGVAPFAMRQAQP